MVDYVNHEELSRLLHEQDYCRLWPFRVRVEIDGYVRNLTIYANTAYYARRMAQCQLKPSDRILSVRAKKGEPIPHIPS